MGSNHLGRVDVVVNQDQKEQTVNDALALYDGAISDTLSVVWAGADASKTISAAQQGSHFAFTMDGSTSALTPVLHFANSDRGFIVVQNNLAVSVDCKDYTTSTTITVAAAASVGMYLTASGISEVLQGASLAEAPSGSVYAREIGGWVDIGGDMTSHTVSSYTPDIDDANDTITIVHATNVNVTIPDDGTVNYREGTKLRFVQGDTGTLTLVAGGSVSFYPTAASLVTGGAQGDWIEVQKVVTGADFWYISGSSSAAAGAVAFTDLTDVPASYTSQALKVLRVNAAATAVEFVDPAQLDLLTFKKAVRVATTANITIATALNNGDTLDGVTLATGDRVLVKDQSSPADNGIYVVGVSPARATDFDNSSDLISSMIIPVQEGTANQDTLWMLTTNAPLVLNTTGLTFAQFSGGGGGSYTDEDAMDAIAAMFAAGSHSGISFSYNDAGDAISATVPGGSGGLTPQPAVVLTSGTTWVATAETILVRLVGAGGNGNTSSSGGGSAGGYVEKLYTGLTIGNSYTYAVGLGNVSAGGHGNDTTFTDGTTLITGQGGRGTASGTSGAGGTATNGDVNIPGSRGGMANTAYNHGGSSPFGSGNPDVASSQGPPIPPGAGGASTAGSWAYGGHGIIIITPYL